MTNKVINIVTKKAHVGNIADWEDEPTVVQLRVLLHHRLREWLARKRTFKHLAEISKVHPTTISRAAHHVGNRTWMGTVHKLAPHLGIELIARAKKDW